MAKSFTSLLLLNSPLSPPSSFSQSLHHLQAKTFPQSQSYFGVGTRTKPISASMVEAQPPVRKEDIIIVGAGIAGLATAVSLHRFGQQSPLIHQNLTRVPGVNLISFCPHSFCNSDYFLYKSCFSYMLSILKIIIK